MGKSLTSKNRTIGCTQVFSVRKEASHFYPIYSIFWQVGTHDVSYFFLTFLLMPLWNKYYSKVYVIFTLEIRRLHHNAVWCTLGRAAPSACARPPRPPRKLLTTRRTPTPLPPPHTPSPTTSWRWRTLSPFASGVALSSPPPRFATASPNTSR